jgi:hypothetical protein
MNASNLRKEQDAPVEAFAKQGLSFTGKTAQLSQVNPLTTNFPEGCITFPIDQQTSELLQQNTKLQMDIQALELKIGKYEREFLSGDLNDGYMSNLQQAYPNSLENDTNTYELLGLRSDVQRLVKENQDLKCHVEDMAMRFCVSRSPPDIDAEATRILFNHQPPLQPSSQAGKQLVSSLLLQLNLPPDDWSEPITQVCQQFIECLEQLQQREEELEKAQTLLQNMEMTLIQVKQHSAALYHDFATKFQIWNKKEREYITDRIELHQERDDLKLKLKRVQEVIDLIQRDDKELIEAKLGELNRKVIIYEANEAILSRKYISMNEFFINERKRKSQLELEFIEMETVLKKRILFLEQNKASLGSKLDFLQAKLDRSIPIDEFKAVTREFESLREEHLVLLKREIEARVKALKVRCLYDLCPSNPFLL